VLATALNKKAAGYPAAFFTSRRCAWRSLS
jgi:hypothetical protein